MPSWASSASPASVASHPDYAIWTLILLAAWQFGSPMLIFWPA